MSNFGGTFSRAVLAVVAGAALGAAILGPAPAAYAADPETVTAVPLTTYQTNGTVLTMQLLNNVIYVGGNFTSVRPAGSALGTNETPRNRLAAFNATTGALLSWNPSATANNYVVVPGSAFDNNCTRVNDTTGQCAAVWAMKLNPAKTKLYIGGDFDYVNGSARSGLASFDLPSGTLDTTYRPATDGRRVRAIAASATTVFAAGSFITVGGVTRNGLASVDATTGALNTGWAPTWTRGTIGRPDMEGLLALELTPDGSRLIIGGGFNSLNGSTIHALGALDPSTGANAAWESKIVPIRTDINNLLIVDGILYSTSEASGSLSEGLITYDANTGKNLSYDSCRGASHSVAILRGVAYVGSHSHECGGMDNGYPEQYLGRPAGDRRRYTLKAEVVNPTGNGRHQLLQWYPQTNDGNGANAMATDGTTLWIGGEFTQVDNKGQQGLTRFTFAGNGGANHVPYTPTKMRGYSTAAGKIDLTWFATEDPDDQNLTYSVYRDNNTTTPIFTTTDASKPWNRNWFQLTDTVAPGSSHIYDVRAVDPKGGRSNRSVQLTVVAASADATTANVAAADGAYLNYNFSSLAGGQYVDSISGRTLTPGAGVTTGTPGLVGDSVTLPGAVGGALTETVSAYGTRQVTYELTFKTDAGYNTGGVLSSLGNSSNPNATSLYDRDAVFMSNDGRLNFGELTQLLRDDPWVNPSYIPGTVTSAASYNDGNWHHVAAVFAPVIGMQLYVDGTLVGSNALYVHGATLASYLRIGGDQSNGWPSAPSSSWFKGSIDEFAAYGYPLTPTQIARHAATFLP